MKKTLLLLILLTSCGLSSNNDIQENKNLNQKNEEIKAEQKEKKSKKLNNGTKKIEKLNGKIGYFEKAIALEKIGFFEYDFEKVGDNTIGSYFDESTNYYQVGNIFLENGKKAKLIMLETTAFYYRGDLLYFINYEGKYYFIPSISETFFIKKDKDINSQLSEYSKKYKKDNIIFDEENRFLDILKKDYLLKDNISFTKGGKKYSLKLEKRTSYFFDKTNLEKIGFLSQKNEKEFYIEKSGDKIWGDENYRKLDKLGYIGVKELGEEIEKNYIKQRSKINFFKSDAVFVKMPDNTTAVYNLEIPFIEKGDYTYSDGTTQEENIMEYISNDGDKNILGHYNYKEGSSCGTKDGTYMYIPDGKYIFDGLRFGFSKGLNREKQFNLTEKERTINYSSDDLVESGEMKNGEKIYNFKDKNHKLLKGMYNYLYISQLNDYGCLDENKKFNPKEIECSNIEFLNYEQYIKSIPLFFWKDPFGRNVMFLSWSTSMPSACGAKPVIYLYPKEKTNIKITLDWNKKILTTIPNYNSFWDVISDENSNIYDKNTQKYYPYLFWEDLMNYKTPEKGFVIKKENISKFLSEKLTYVGLNKKEISDFKEYWIPKMQEKPYYFITFLQTQELNKIVPITINPKPDNIFRIFMDFKGLDEYKKVEELNLQKFERSGFSVIEWGGNLE